MKNIFFTSLFALIFLNIINAQQLKSPDNNFTLSFNLLEEGIPSYSLSYKDKEIIKPSKLGLELKNDNQSLLNNFGIIDSSTITFDETSYVTAPRP